MSICKGVQMHTVLTIKWRIDHRNEGIHDIWMYIFNFILSYICLYVWQPCSVQWRHLLPLHLIMWKSFDKHIMWVWYSVCWNKCQPQMYLCFAETLTLNIMSWWLGLSNTLKLSLATVFLAVNVTKGKMILGAISFLFITLSANGVVVAHNRPSKTLC